jgi:prepilin-type N-terminal cleavage/methylation domain-containing protein
MRDAIRITQPDVKGELMPCGSRMIFPSIKKSAAFSLIELLVVIGIIALLASMLVFSTKGGGAKLSTAGVQIAGLMDQAREVAILKRQPTALVMLAGGDEVAGRVFAVLGYVPAATGPGAWERLSRWEALPAGVLADEGVDSGGNPLQALKPSNSPAVNPTLPTLSYAGASYAPGTQYGYVVFLPDGGVYQDSGGAPATPLVLRLVDAVREGGSVRYTSKQEAGRSVNFFEITLNQPTGLAKITRP